ncbi:MAG TPA: DUF4140 domain-containing protein, partial [Cytophagaceae bacterium]|nr:DUF4140 domain-containing protein [Cytophagaceae bacterium]
MFKSKILILLFLFASLISFAQEKEVKVNSKITDVMVYLNGASVHREASVNVGIGRTKLKFSGLPVGLDANSIQVAVTGNAKIISISKENDFLNNKKQNKRIALLKDSLESIQLQLEKLQSDKGVYEQEKKLLTDNVSRIGEGGGVKITELTAATSFYRTKIKELNDKLFTMNQEERRLNNLIAEH